MSVDIFMKVKTFRILYFSQIKVPSMKYLEITQCFFINLADTIS